MAESGAHRSDDGRVSPCPMESKHNLHLDGAVPGNPGLALGSSRRGDSLEADITSEDGEVMRRDAIPPPASIGGRHATAFLRVHDSSSFRYALEYVGVNTDRLLQKVGCPQLPLTSCPQYPRHDLWKTQRGWKVEVAPNNDPESSPSKRASVLGPFKGGPEPSEVGGQLYSVLCSGDAASDGIGARSPVTAAYVWCCGFCPYIYPSCPGFCTWITTS